MEWTVKSKMIKKMRFSHEKSRRVTEVLSFHFGRPCPEQKGNCTEAQRRGLARRKLVWPFRNVIAVSILVLFGFLVIFLKGGLFILQHSAIYYMAGGMILIVVAGSYIPLFFEKRDLKLKTAHGPARIIDRLKTERAISENGVGYHRNSEYYRVSRVTEMFVEGVAFGVDGIVEHGDICRIYYVGKYDIISIEVMD